MAQDGFAVVAIRSAAQWTFEPLPPAVLDDLSALLRALRAQPGEGGPFVVADVDDEFFLIARARAGQHVELLLSDLTASVEYDLAAQVLERLGEDPPDEDELDEMWPLGDLDIFADLGVSEDEMADIVDDLDAYPDEMLDAIMERITAGDGYRSAVELASVR